LGASRARIVQQLTTEATMLTITGAALGLVLAYWAAQLASTVAPPVLATQQYTVLDWSVIRFATLLALITGLVFGVFPVVLMGRMQPTDQLVRSQPGMRDAKRVRFTLLAFQAVVTLVLLASSITMGRTFLKIIGTDLGFRPESALTMRVSLQGTKHRSGPAQWKYYKEALERLRSVPGVTEAGAVGYLPLAFNVYMSNAFKFDSGQTIEAVVTNGATEGYFQAIGTNLLAGRDFRSGDGSGSDRVVIVNEAFARKTELGSSVVGRRITAPWSKTPYLIAGVVETSRAFGPSQPGAPMIYWPVQEEPSANLTLVARTTGDPETFLTRCRDAVKSLDPEVPIFDIRTLEQRLTEIIARPRFFTTATVFLAAIAFFLAAVGTFGSAAQSVAQRSREIGIRLALGGSHTRVRTMLLRENIAPTILGSLAGVVVAAGCGRYLQHVIDNTEAIEPSSYATAASLLLLCALLATWRATARIMEIQPADSVRTN
jgi:putative ABC transport system permease protein